jgi:hypothetical protein
MSPKITVAGAASQKRIDANRRNARRSTGPRTPDGKSRSRFNGLKHCPTASVPVIPAEDPAVYEARLEAMIELSAARLANQTIKTFLSVVLCPLSVDGPSDARYPLAGEASPIDSRQSFKPEPTASVLTPERTEPNTPPEEWQPKSSLTPEPIADNEPESELAELNMYRAVLHSMISPIDWPAITRSERTEPKKRCRSRPRKPAKTRRQN